MLYYNKCTLFECKNIDIIGDYNEHKNTSTIFIRISSNGLLSHTHDQLKEGQRLQLKSEAHFNEQYSSTNTLEQ